MGKSSKSSYPKFSDSSFQINGKEVAAIKKKHGVVQSNYNTTPSEQQLYNNIQKNLALSVNNLFKISDSTKKDWNNQLNTYKQMGIDNINSIYTPMETQLKNDIASRFGNLDNSIFLDNLKDITDDKSKAVAQLSNELTLKKNQLYSQEMQNRMNYINLLSDLNIDYDNRMLSYLGMAKDYSNLGNNYNLQTRRNSSSGGGLLGLDIGSSLGATGSLLSSSHPYAAAAMTALSFL